MKFIKAERQTTNSVIATHEILGATVLIEWNNIHPGTGEVLEYDASIEDIITDNDELRERIEEAFHGGKDDSNDDVEIYLHLRDSFDADAAEEMLFEGKIEYSCSYEKIEEVKEYSDGKNDCAFFIEKDGVFELVQYNFTNDVITCHISYENLLRILVYCVNNCWGEVVRLASEKFKSRSGFISFHDDKADANKWRMVDVPDFTVEWIPILEAAFLHVINDEEGDFDMNDYEIEFAEVINDE